METTLIPFLRSIALSATECSLFHVNRENFQTRITRNGAFVLLASCSISWNCGLWTIRPLSA